MQHNQSDSSSRTKMPEGKAPSVAPSSKSGADLPLSTNNFIMMGISLLLIVIGFALTSGAPSGLDEYNPDIFSARRIVIGPALCFIGFVLMAVAIIIKPKGKQ